MFFVLSGFLITTRLVTDQRRWGRIRLGAFYIHRAARLYPALLAVAAVCLVLGKPPVDVLLAAFYMSDFALGSGHSMGALTHTWSLAVEEQFYMLAPLTLMIARGRWRAWSIGATIVAAGVTIWRLEYWSTVATSLPWIYYGPTRIDGIIFGCTLAVWFQQRGRAWAPPRCLVAMSAIYVSVYASGAWSNTWSMFTLGLVGLSLAGVVVIAWGVQHTGPLASGPLLFVGRISYGLYLWHYPIFGFIDNRGLPKPTASVMEWGLSVIVATASFYLMERPIQSFVRARCARRAVTAMAERSVRVPSGRGLPDRP